MGGIPSIVELLFRIAADNSPLKATVAESQAVVSQGTAAINSQVASSTAAAAEGARRTFAQQLKEQGLSAERAAEVYARLGAGQKEAAADITAAYGAASASAAATTGAAETAGAAVAGASGESLNLARQQVGVQAAIAGSTEKVLGFGAAAAPAFGEAAVQAGAARAGIEGIGAQAAASAAIAREAGVTIAVALREQGLSAEKVRSVYQQLGVQERVAAVEVAQAFALTGAASMQAGSAAAVVAESTERAALAARDLAVQEEAVGVSAKGAAASMTAAGIAGVESLGGAAAQAQAAKTTIAGAGEAATAAGAATVAAAEGVNATAAAMGKTIAQSAREQGASAAQAAQIYKQLGMAGAESAAEIAAAFGVAGAAARGAAGQAAGLGAASTQAAGETVAANERTATSYAELMIRQAALKTALGAAVKEAVAMREIGGPAYEAARLEVARLNTQLLATREEMALVSAGGVQVGAAAAVGAAEGAAAVEGNLVPAMKHATNEIRQAHASAILLERQLGIHLPRGVTSMIAHSELLGSILTKVFAVTILVYFAQELDHIRQKIADVALAFGGFGEKARKSMDDAIEANNKALVSFKDVKAGVDLSAEVNRTSASLEHQRAELEKSGGVATQYLETLRNLFAPTLTNQLSAHEHGLKAVGEATAENNKRAVETITQLGKLTVEQARYNLEVLKAKDAALAVGLARSDQLKLQLRELSDERELELRTAAGSADKIAKIEGEFRWKRVELERQITKALYDEAEKQHKPLVEALEKYNDMLGRLQGQYDSGTAAVKRYLETERQLAEIEAKGPDVWMARKINIQLLERERTEAVTKATQEATRAIEGQNAPMLAWLDSMVAAQSAQLRLSDAERAALPLIGDHTNALQRMLDNSRAVVESMLNEELPARQRIEAQIERQRMAGWRALQTGLNDEKKTLAEKEALWEQYYALLASLEKQREGTIDRETNYMKRAVVQQRQALQQMRQELESTQLSFLSLEVAGVKAFMALGQGMGASIADAIVYEKSVGAAMAAALKSTLASISAEAFVRAIYATALGFYYLATKQYESAGQAFTAAAIWGTIGGAAAVAGRAIPGGETTSAGRGPDSTATPATAATTPAPLSAGAASAEGPRENAPPPQQTIIYLTIEGDYLALPQSADRLVDHIDKAVTERDRILHSTHTLRPPPAGR